MAERKGAAFAAVPLRALGADLSLVELRVLVAVAGFDRMTDLGDGSATPCTAPLPTIAAMAGVEYSRASVAIARLVKKGLLKRTQDPDDGRKRHLQVVYTDDAKAWRRRLNRLPGGKEHSLPGGKEPGAESLPGGKEFSADSLPGGKQSQAESATIPTGCKAPSYTEKRKNKEGAAASDSSSTQQTESSPPSSQYAGEGKDSIGRKGGEATPEELAGYERFRRLHPDALTGRAVVLPRYLALVRSGRVTGEILAAGALHYRLKFQQSGKEARFVIGLQRWLSDDERGWADAEAEMANERECKAKSGYPPRLLTWPEVVAFFRAGGWQDDWGARPFEPGCRIPLRYLIDLDPAKHKPMPAWERSF